MGFSSASVLLFVLGVAIGSFLNVLAFRYDPDKSIFRKGVVGGRSHCMGCGKTLSIFELIPLLSFIFQRGKCRSCGVRLSFQYPVIELFAGVITAGIPIVVYAAYGVSFHRAGEVLPLWYFIAAGIFLLASYTYLFLSAVDLRLTIIPDQSNLLIVALGGLKVWLLTATPAWGDFTGSFSGHYAAIFGLRENIFLNHIVAGIFGLAFFGAIWMLSRGRAMGMGDVKLAGATGVLLGWPDTAFALLLAFIVGALFGILLIVRRRKTMKSSVPFGPFIAVGGALVFFFGRQLLDWYFSIFP